jgi:hypothetical protein
MVKFAKGALLAGVVSLALSSVATAQLPPDVNPVEFKCQQSANKFGAKYVGSLTKCATKCQQGFFKGDNVNYPGGSQDCYDAPYGGATATCVDTPLKGANQKFTAALQKACDPAIKPTNDCPECYSAQGGGNGCGLSGYAGTRQQDIENQVDTFGPGVFCKTTGATKAEQKCMQNTGKVLSKHVGALDKCFDKCFKNASKSLVNSTDCQPNPTLPNDAPTQACINAASAKTTAGVNKLCSDAGVVIASLCPQFCHTNSDCDTGPPDGVCTNNNCSAGNTSTHAYFTGAGWTTLVTNAIDGNIPGTYCDSPSSAFLD